MKVFSKKKLKAYRNNWRIKWLIKLSVIKGRFDLKLKEVLNQAEPLFNDCNRSAYGNVAIKIFSFSVF